MSNRLISKAFNLAFEIKLGTFPTALLLHKQQNMHEEDNDRNN